MLREKILDSHPVFFSLSCYSFVNTHIASAELTSFSDKFFNKLCQILKRLKRSLGGDNVKMVSKGVRFFFGGKYRRIGDII